MAINDDYTGYALAIERWSGITTRPVKINGFEMIMGLYWFEIDLVVPGTVQPERLKIDDAIGSPAVLRVLKHQQPALPMEAANTWPIHGVIQRITHLGSNGDWHLFRLQLVPELVLLSGARRTRVWRDQSVKGIVKKVCEEARIAAPAWEAKAGVETRPYLVQYQETDLAFIERLCARLGVWYQFAFGTGATTLAFHDQQTAFAKLTGGKCYDLRPEARSVAGGGKDGQGQVISASAWDLPEVVNSLELTRQLVPGAVLVRGWDYHGADDGAHPESQAQAPVSSPMPDDWRFGLQAPERGTECGASGDDKQGQPGCAFLAKVLAERHAVDHKTGGGRSTIRNLRAGLILSMMNGGTPQDYVVIGVRHLGSQGAGGRGSSSRSDLSYRNWFVAIPKEDKVPYRPAERPWPQIPGFLTAQVESEGGDGDPYANLDDQGRYHVRLAADRENTGDAKASLPVRMLSPYSGKEWGFHLPLHHGAEVMLAHVDGDPDRPVIAGAVPNGVTPQVVNHDNQTQSRWLTAGKNELTFDDKKDSEMAFLHAQKDRKTEVENDETKTVGHDQSLDVGNDQKIHVKKNRADNVDENVEANVGGNVTLMVKKNVSETIEGGQTEEIKKDKSESITGASTLAIGKDLTVTVDGDHSDSSKKGRTIKAKKISILADDEITIKTGSAIIQMKKNGDITIEGKKISIKGSGDVVVKGSKIGEN